MLTPLADRTYRHLFLAQVIALVGSGLATVALGLLAHDLAGDDAGAVLGTALAVKMVAYVGIAPVVGAFADRLPRRAFLVAMDVVRAAIALTLPFVSEVWHVYVLIFALQSASAAFTPTFQATIPDILPNEGEYTKALSLSRLAYDLESLLSPVLAAALLTVTGFHALFAGTALGFVGSALLVASVLLPRPAPATREGGIVARTTRGIRLYLATPRLRGLLALNAATAAAGAMVIVNTVVIVRVGLDRPDTDVAVALASYGSGSMLAAMLLPRVLVRVSERTAMVPAALVLALVLFLFAAGGLFPNGAGQTRWPALLGIWFLLGAAGSTIVTPAGRLLRRSAHPEDRPALFAAQFALSHACWLVTYPLAGWLGAGLGTATTALVLGMLALGGSAAAAVLWPAGDPSVIGHVHADLPADHPHVRDAEPVPGGRRHRHAFVIDRHHPLWPEPGR